MSDYFVRLSFVPEPVSLIIAESIEEEADDDEFEEEWRRSYLSQTPSEGDMIHAVDYWGTTAATPQPFRDA